MAFREGLRAYGDLPYYHAVKNVASTDLTCTCLQTTTHRLILLELSGEAVETETQKGDAIYVLPPPYWLALIERKA